MLSILNVDNKRIDRYTTEKQVENNTRAFLECRANRRQEMENIHDLRFS